MALATSNSPLLQLPAEIRLNIYKFFIDIRGKIVVFARYDIAKEVDTDTVNLMHVSRVIRKEVQEFFYKRQAFEFRSIPAIDNFLARIGRDHASLITDVTFAEWMCRKIRTEEIISLLGWLTGLERFALEGWTNMCENTEDEKEKTLVGAGSAILRASKSLSAGNVWVHYNHLRHTTIFAPKSQNFSSGMGDKHDNYPFFCSNRYYKIRVRDRDRWPNQEKSNEENAGSEEEKSD